MSCENFDFLLVGHNRKPHPGICNWYQEWESPCGFGPVRSDTTSKDTVLELWVNVRALCLLSAAELSEG